MTLFDANTWIGRWPFAFCDAHTPATLAAHLRRHGIDRALVSPLDAVLAPEPGPANRHLLATTRGQRRFEPVPVINPALAGWWDDVAEADADPRVRAVRLLPAYHHYRLGTKAVDALIGELRERGLKLIVQMQLIDARHEYHGMTIKPVPAADLAALLRRHRNFPVLASGLMRPELKALAGKFPALLADLSFAEWHDTMEHLRAAVPAERLAFASHTPILITAAARAKLETSALPAAEKRTIGASNLERFLTG
jgi:hypothetical protein